MVARQRVNVMILQETWTTEAHSRLISPDGYLFLIHGSPRNPDQRDRNSCGVGFILSPATVVSWESIGATFEVHPSSDGNTCLASIRLKVRESTGRTVDFFTTSVYLPDQGHEDDHLIESVLNNLSAAIPCGSSQNVLVIRLDAHMQVRTSARAERRDGQETRNPVIASPRST